jgi:hypothetical protein
MPPGAAGAPPACPQLCTATMNAASSSVRRRSGMDRIPNKRFMQVRIEKRRAADVRGLTIWIHII